MNEIEKFLPPQAQELVTDLDYSRKNIYQLIETGIAACQPLSEIAAQSQNPRAFEVLGNFLKTMADLQKDLVEISRTKKEQDDEALPGTTNITNNLIFHGTTNDLQNFIKKKTDEDI